MQNPLQITVRDMAHSPALDENIREKVAKLDQVFSPIISCHVLAESPHKHHQHGRQFNVRVDLTLPGKTIVVNHDHDEDVYVAVRDAFNAVRRQLEQHTRMQRGKERALRDHGRGASRPIGETENE
jgi:ribosomal subunit interface protein